MSDRQKADAILEHLLDDVWNTITPRFTGLTDAPTYNQIKIKLTEMYSPTPTDRAQ